MRTITLRIDEQTRFGKQFLNLVEFFVSEKKGISLLKEEENINDVFPNKDNSNTLEKPMSKSEIESIEKGLIQADRADLISSKEVHKKAKLLCSK